MDYQKIYNSIIERRKLNPLEGYTEKHHILPKCLGGGDKKENVVNLSAREHYICHLLLTKIYKDDKYKYSKMVRAFMLMCWCHCKSKQQRYFASSKKYEKLKQEFSKIISANQIGKGNSQSGKIWIYNLDLEISKKISKDEEITEGWQKGRVVDFKQFKENILQKQNKKPKKGISDKRKEMNLKNELANIEKFTKYYEIYKNVSFKEFCSITGYDKKFSTLCWAFNKYVSEYKESEKKKI